MILGTYWYFDFPINLYKFDFFEFKKGYGGHADNPAELVTIFEAKHPEKIIEDLKNLIDKNSDGYLFVYQEQHKLKIGTGGYQLFDYDFLLIKEVEKLLRNHRAYPAKDKTLRNPTLIKLCNENPKNKITYPKQTFLQVVGSELKKHNAENSKLRLDCNIDLEYKEDFIKDLESILKDEKIDVFFYYESEFENRTNLMLFFTNGRQGLNLREKIYIDILSFENKVEKTITTYNAKFGFLGGYDSYPQNGPKIERIIEKEMII
ncbi:hypothetical protein BZARG_2837 [Bizionia argentinensis JUB59]|uniref:Uncharacterized protein n=1 Tax=Bizionia argentinensis JUB59 TaxID=1046627 RepID=G2EDA5_9FLAO|nr:hypothetical protein [Bizionia argentinensis]EGV43563.1 hypothetical protein BZARG_2837 [Bizionia argentinensis JUB59]